MHPDVRTLEAEKGTISVDQVRRLRADAYVKPNDGDAKGLYHPRGVADDAAGAERVAEGAGQPPDGVTFLLCDRRADGILETLRSRMVAFSLAEGAAPDGGGFACSIPLLEAVVRRQAHGVYEAAAGACKTRDQALLFWESLLSALRDLMLLREAPAG